MGDIKTKELRQYIKFRRVVGDTNMLNGEMVDIPTAIEDALNYIEELEIENEQASDFNDELLEER